jgi:tetratricopeptide (TPR) repeat protein
MSSITINNSLFLKGQSSFALFTEIVGAVRSQRGLDYVAAEVIDHAHRAWHSREIEACKSASAFVLALDVSPKLHTIAEYYKTLCKREQVADPEANRTTLIQTANECGGEYLPRIILLVGNSYHGEENYGEALRCYIEAGKAARGRDILSQTQSVWNIAVLESDCGDSAGALQRFESISPIIGSLCHWYPTLYADYLNNLAALLAENGRVEESRQAIKVALASPFAARFPEWRETAREIEEAARSEPRGSAPTLKPAVTTLPVRHKEPRLQIKRQPGLPFICIVRFDLTNPLIPLRGWGRYVVSQLDRYVKIARVRAPPVSL